VLLKELRRFYGIVRLHTQLEDSTEYSRSSQGARRFFFEKQMIVGDLDGIEDTEEQRKLSGI
jgi:hypothetical protein